MVMDTRRPSPLTSELRTHDALSSINSSLIAKIVDMDWSGEHVIKVYLLINDGKLISLLYC